MDTRSPVMWSRIPSPLTDPSSSMKAALSVFSAVTPPKDQNNSLMSVGTFPEAEYPNKAGGSFLGPNGRSPPFALDASSAVNEMHGRSGSQPGRWSRALRTAGKHG